jgi:hypothetical protein
MLAENAARCPALCESGDLGLLEVSLAGEAA